MFKKLLEDKSWQFAGLEFKVRQPMLLDREICTVTEEDGTLIITVPDGPHPYIKNTRASAIHYIPKEDIQSISFYNALVPSTIMTPPGANKVGKIIT